MNKSLVALAVFVATLMPAPAFAWFGWLDKLSGAGPFWGLLFDVRAVCFGEEYKGPKTADALEAVSRAVTAERQSAAEYTAAQNAYADARSNKRKWEDVEGLYTSVLQSSRTTETQWNDAVKIWHASALAWAALADSPREYQTAATSPFPAPPNQPPDECKPVEGEGSPSQRRVENELRPQACALQFRIAQLRTSTLTERDVAEEKRQKSAFARSFGVEISACKEVRRRSSFDVGVGIWKVLDDDSPYADDRMTTAKTAYSVRLFDWLDYSTSVGVFWVTSSRYDGVRGVYFEPARLGVHAPSSWSTLSFSNPKRIAAIPVFVWGPVVFPNGFKANAFGAAQPERIKGEAIYKNFAVFFNVHPTARRHKMNE